MNWIYKSCVIIINIQILIQKEYFNIRMFSEVFNRSLPLDVGSEGENLMLTEWLIDVRFGENSFMTTNLI